jgi:aminoglycoside 2'-N-acetyltransferase I
MSKMVTAWTRDLTDEALASTVTLLEAAFEESFESYWNDIGPARHFMVVSHGNLLAHACVVDRELHTQGHELKTGYVEGVATWPELQGRSHATTAMRAVNVFISENHQLGGLSTGGHAFYERLGWEPWRGPTYIRRVDGSLQRTGADDGTVMVLRTPRTPPLDPSAPISAEWRPGELW